jgi:3-keto steroid reductase
LTSPSTSPKKHLILILCTRAPIKTRFTISRLRGDLRKIAEYSSFADAQRKKAKSQGAEYKWEDVVRRVHFLGVEADLCDLNSVYALADKLVNGTVGSPEATTMDGGKLPYGSPGTHSFSEDIKQDYWALSQKEGSSGAQRSWGWGLSGIRLPRLDVIVLNAGIGGWIGLNWPLAIKEVLMDVVQGVTWPTFKLADMGAVTKPQTSSSNTTSDDDDAKPLLSSQERSNEPPLGKVFCSNIFGHYLLAHELMPLLSKPASTSSKSGGKVVWMSSIEAMSSAFLDAEDIQGLRSTTSYESTKRLADVLALTSDLPSVQRYSTSFFNIKDTVSASRSRIIDTDDDNLPVLKPKLYVTHPGVFASEIIPLHAILVFIYKFVFLFARWIGSPWHTIDPWKAAVAPVWVTLADEELLEDLEGTKFKWGSATDTSGEERVMKTEVPGWGWDGVVGTAIDAEKRKGRKKGAVDLTKDQREEFEILGAKCWRQMEALRKEWETVLGVKTVKN